MATFTTTGTRQLVVAKFANFMRSLSIEEQTVLLRDVLDSPELQPQDELVVRVMPQAKGSPAETNLPG